ncbi:hypothetical protein C6P40_000778 [Pichia californica]|uniref:DNA-binding protein RAP1 n=1 Tax=Pichia californica TaxID=460514 RepID=A0A9P6WPH7_9ASCO|nr:hypothetical protein C6P42_000448 [[Candida] californica]KAG0690882.1 hypothetical protein C6P40_000778 [[Candida] californica]
MFGKSDIFVDAALNPYNFYLCDPLDKSETLVRMIEENGGNVVDDYSQTCIIISQKNSEIPDDLKSAHIYSYEVIQDSVNRGTQQEFTQYLIYIPQSQQESTPQQFSDDRAITLNGDVNDYNFDELNAALQSTNSSNQSIINNQLFNNTNTTSIPYNDNSVRYFTTEEDNILKEEIRKRHFMGIKGHTIYEVISQLPYFVNRIRTPASLRERMRTLKYNVGFVYKLDRKNRLLKDANGNYIKTTQISNKLKQYTAEDDLILCKTIYFKLDIVTDIQGFEHVVYPTNFFDRFALVYDNHTPESWRQRYKNFLSLFGIVNYLKYYIMQCKLGKQPLPANIADKEYLAARKKTKGKAAPIIYLPNIPQDNRFIDDNVEFITPRGYDNKIFEFINPFKKIEENNHDEDSTTENSVIESITRESTNEPENSTLSSQTLHQNQTDDNEILNFNVENSINNINNIENSSNQENNNKQFFSGDIKKADHLISQDNNINSVNENIDKLSNDNVQTEIQNEPLFVETQTNDNTNNSNIVTEKEPEVEVEQFIDEPTTEFVQLVFKRYRKKKGPPVNLSKITDPVEWIKKMDIIVNLKLPPTVITKQLEDIGVEQYYTIYLFHRCLSNRVLMSHCISNYVNTHGVELLAIEPGIWSDKSMRMYEMEDSKLNEILIKYHGAKSFKKRPKDKGRYGTLDK